MPFVSTIFRRNDKMIDIVVETFGKRLNVEW